MFRGRSKPLSTFGLRVRLPALSDTGPRNEELFGSEALFTGQDLAKRAKHLGIRSGEDTDRRFFVYDKKVKRVFYLCADIQHIIEMLRLEPNDCLRAFSSQAIIQAYEARQG